MACTAPTGDAKEYLLFFYHGVTIDEFSWLKIIRRNLINPMNQVTLMALRDYYLGRFGSCPDQVRKLAKNARELPNRSNFQ